MEPMNTILYYLMFMMESFIYWRIMSCILDNKYHKRYQITAAVIFFVLEVMKKIVFSLPGMKEYLAIGTLIIFIYILLTYLLMNKNPIIEKIVWCFVLSFGLALSELILIILIKVILDKPLSEISTDLNSTYIVFIGKIFTVLLYEMIIRKRKGNYLINFIYFKELAIIISLNLFLILVSVYLFSNDQDVLSENNNIILLIFAVITIITIYTIILIFRLEKKSKEEIETQLRLQKIELELKLNNDMIDITDKLRKLRHDMNNHIGLIKALMKAKKYEELDEYINQIYEDVEIANELVITENKTLSVLLNSKKNLAKSKNIDFSSVIATQDINMQSKDICSLLGNILDNAIEAAEKSGNKKYVQLMIQKTEEGCIINCENSLGVKPIVKKGKFITMKDNALLHGIGTENIKDIVSKYSGEINFDYDDEMFNVRVVMPV